MSRVTEPASPPDPQSLARRDARRIQAAADIRRRSRIAVAAALTALGLVWVVPGLALRPLHDPSGLGFGTGLAVALGIDVVRAMSNARGHQRAHDAKGGLLTARTWTGPRTVDLRSLRSVRARRITGRGKPTSYLVVTDTAGVRISLSGRGDIQLVRRELDRQARGLQWGTAPVRVSRLARGVLGTEPLPKWLSGLWSLGSGELTLMVGMACAFTIILWIAK